MTDELDDYPVGPEFVEGCEASRDGARAAALVKATQEAVLLAAAGLDGVTYHEASDAVGDAIRPDVVRARLSCMKKARKVVKLPVCRMGGCRVCVSAYALPQFAPSVDEAQALLGINS
jgi:hypothetical protein